jgi:hypothetical protein
MAGFVSVKLRKDGNILFNSNLVQVGSLLGNSSRCGTKSASFSRYFVILASNLLLLLLFVFLVSWFVYHFIS